MERRLVYQVREAPDRTLARVQQALEHDGFNVAHGDEFDLAARRGADRVFLGLAPHPDGLVARVRTAALVPGRGGDLLRRVRALLDEQLGTPTSRGGGPGG